MATSYFSKFTTILYDIDNTGKNVRLVTDIMHRAAFLQLVLNNSLIFYEYTVKDGETPEIIASKLYGSPDYYWVVCYANNIFSIWDDWPLSYDQMQAFLTSKYGSVQVAQTIIDHYQDQYGATIDLYTYEHTPGNTIVYADQAAIAANQIKAQIRLVDPQYVPTIEKQLEAILIPSST